MDNKWYRAAMEKEHRGCGYEKDLLVYFKFDMPVDPELMARIYGPEKVREMASTVIVYDGESSKYFKLPSSEVGNYIRAEKDEFRRPIPAEDQFMVQYNFIGRCK